MQIQLAAKVMGLLDLGIEMNGIYFSSRPMHINEATPKKSLGFQQPYSMKGMFFKDRRLYLYVFISSFMYILIGHFTYVL